MGVQKIDYQALYALQDRVMEIVFGLENEFYLTGGTALHRFYYGLRYSDDLDFFVSGDMQFAENVREVLDILEREHTVEVIASTRDFHRIVVDKLLQVDFVNDRVYRYGKSVVIEHKRIDNVTNILTNKIGAIMDRDEPKDVFDLVIIAREEQFNWKEILEIAGKKAIIDKEELAYRLETFPVAMFERIHLVQPMTIEKEEINIIANDIQSEGENRLFFESQKQVGSYMKRGGPKM